MDFESTRDKLQRMGAEMQVGISNAFVEATAYNLRKKRASQIYAQVSSYLDASSRAIAGHVARELASPAHLICLAQWSAKMLLRARGLVSQIKP